VSPEELRTFRERHRLLGTDMAAYLGVCPSTYSRWERGVFPPNSWEILRLALAQLEREIPTKPEIHPRSRRCAHCAAVFPLPLTHPYQRFCSKRCASRSYDRIRGKERLR
jgi:transcriptional regulator with XRE-family HTH domain